MLTADDFKPLQQVALEICEASLIDLGVEGVSSVARVPSRLTAKLAEELNALARKEQPRKCRRL